MQVNTNRVRPPGVTGDIAGTSQRSGAHSALRESGQFEATASLNLALGQTPSVRSEEVARAKKLVDTSLYPPPEILTRLARFLADTVLSADS